MLESYDDNYRLQFNTETLMFFLRSSGQVAVQSSGLVNYISIPTTDNYPNAMVALSPPDGAAYCVAWNGRVDNKRVFQTNAAVGTVVDYYVFEPSSNIPATNVGVQLTNEAGQVYFSTTQYALWGLAAIQANSSNSHSAPGRKLAVAPLSYMGLNRYYDEVEETGPGGAPVWNYSHDIVGYGFSLTNGRQTALPANITILSERTLRPTIPYDNAYDRGGLLFVLDVTPAPVGFVGF